MLTEQKRSASPRIRQKWMITLYLTYPKHLYASESWAQNLYILSVNEDFKRL